MISTLVKSVLAMAVLSMPMMANAEGLCVDHASAPGVSAASLNLDTIKRIRNEFVSVHSAYYGIAQSLDNPNDHYVVGGVAYSQRDMNQSMKEIDASLQEINASIAKGERASLSDCQSAERDRSELSTMIDPSAGSIKYGPSADDSQD